MLIEAPYKENDTISFKLVSGEEAVAKLVTETDTEIKVSCPMLLMMSAQGPALTPFLLSVDPQNSKTTIKKEHVIAIFKSHQDISSAYIQQTTGIVT